MSAPKNRTKGAFMGPLWEKPRQKGRTTAMFAQKARDSGIGGFLSSATVSYSDHPILWRSPYRQASPRAPMSTSPLALSSTARRAFMHSSGSSWIRFSPAQQKPPQLDHAPCRYQRPHQGHDHLRRRKHLPCRAQNRASCSSASCVRRTGRGKSGPPTERERHRRNHSCLCITAFL